MITIILIAIVLILICYHYSVHHGYRGKFINLIPGPRTLPFVGNLHIYQVPPDGVWQVTRLISKQYYPIFKLWSFAEPCVNIRHPDDIEVILGSHKHTTKSTLYVLLRGWFGTGLLTSAGTKWQTRRKILTPAFHFNVLHNFTDVFIEESERMCTALKEEGVPIVKDLLTFASRHTLNMICETAMGTSLNGKGKLQSTYHEAVYDLGQVIVNRLVRPWLYRDSLFSLTSLGRAHARLLKILHGFTRMIVSERKEYHNQTDGRYLMGFGDDRTNEDVEIKADYGIRKRRLAMLDLLIAAHRNNQIDDDGIREEVDTFMFEGHDTTAMAMCFSIMLLAEHKEIQDRAREEVDAVFEENGGKISMASLQSLSYLERCIKESLRLYPSVHFISRMTDEDVQLSGYFIPAGTITHVHLFDVHHDPKFWPNPEVFDPDRFLPENTRGRHPYSYIPFSAGPRNCIGQRFAMLELKTIIGYLLHNFRFEPVDYLKDLRVTADLVIRPAHPIRTRFIPIN